MTLGWLVLRMNPIEGDITSCHTYPMTGRGDVARILWTPAFQAGSYFPAVPIALELQARGHELTVLCEAGSELTFRSLGFDFRVTVRLDSALLDQSLRGGERETKLRRHETYVRALFEDVSRELGSRRYDALFFDPLEPGSDFAAEAAGVESVSYAHWCMDETGADVPFCFHFWDRETPAPEAFVGWWNEQRALVGLAPEPRSPSEHRWYRQSRSLTLILGLPELAYPKGELPPYALRVGPLVWDPVAQQVLPAWVDQVGRDRPAILASVSTVGRADAQLISTLAEAVRDEPVDVVLTVPVDGEVPPLPDNVRLAQFVPHSALIERVSLVICHAGNGVVTRAACTGVPLLLFPDGRDRFEVARGATEAGIAITVDRDHCDTTTTRQAIRTLLKDGHYSRRATELARTATNYTAAATAATAIEQLLQQPTAPPAAHIQN